MKRSSYPMLYRSSYLVFLQTLSSGRSGTFDDDRVQALLKLAAKSRRLCSRDLIAGMNSRCIFKTFRRTKENSRKVVHQIC